MKFAPTAEEEAQRVNDQAGPNRYGMNLVTDQNFWEKQGISTGEELALSLMSQTYSDMHKSIYRKRPKGPAFSSVEEAGAAIENLDSVYEEMRAQEELDVQAQREYESKEAELAALMPGPYDYENYAKQSGTGRRMENKIRLSKKQLLEIVAETMSMPTLDQVVDEFQDADSGETYGHGGSARHSKQQLFNISTLSQSLHDRLHDDDELPEWIQSTLAVVDSKLLDVAAHLEYKMHRKDEGR